MTGNAAPCVRGGPVPSALPSDDLTHVELTHIEKKIEHWVRFGRLAEETILDRRRRIFAFRPGAIFAFVRWAANDFGTILSRIDIVRAVVFILLLCALLLCGSSSPVTSITLASPPAVVPAVSFPPSCWPRA